jgi:hypothetical protein
MKRIIANIRAGGVLINAQKQGDTCALSTDRAAITSVLPSSLAAMSACICPIRHGCCLGHDPPDATLAWEHVPI